MYKCVKLLGIIHSGCGPCALLLLHFGSDCIYHLWRSWWWWWDRQYVFLNPPMACIHETYHSKLHLWEDSTSFVKRRGLTWSLCSSPLSHCEVTMCCSFSLQCFHVLLDKQEPAGKPFCKLVGMDWFKSKDRMDHIAGRPRSLVQVRSVRLR